MTWFNKQSRLAQILLLLIPFVNWIVELYVRWTSWAKQGGPLRFVAALFVTIFGMVFGWLDLIWVLLFKRLLLQ